MSHQYSMAAMSVPDQDSPSESAGQDSVPDSPAPAINTVAAGSTGPVYSFDVLLRHRLESNPRDVPNEIRNFRLYLTKCPQLAEQLQLVVERDGILCLNGSPIDPSKVILRKLKSILNRLTEANYARLLGEVKKLEHVDDPEVMHGIIEALIQNSKQSEQAIKLYATLTKDVEDEKLWTLGDVPFSTALESACLQQFEAFQDPTHRQELRTRLASIPDVDARFEVEAKAKRGGRAMVVLLASLYKQGLSSAAQIGRVLTRLLDADHADPERVDDYNIDFFLAAYPTARAKLRVDDRATCDRVHAALRAVAANEGVGFRIKFQVTEFLGKLAAEDQQSGLGKPARYRHPSSAAAVAGPGRTAAPVRSPAPVRTTEPSPRARAPHRPESNSGSNSGSSSGAGGGAWGKHRQFARI